MRTHPLSVLRSGFRRCKVLSVCPSTTDRRTGIQLAETQPVAGHRCTKAVLLACRFITLAMPFVITEPLLRALGSDLYGGYMVASSAAATLAFLDLGIHDATLTRLARSLGRGSKSEAKRVLGSSYLLLGLISVVISIVLFVLISLSSVAFPLQVAGLGQPMVFACVLLPQILSLPFGLLIRLLQARNNHVTAAIVQVLGPGLATIVTLGLIGLNMRGIPLVISMTVTPLAVSCALHVFYFLRHADLLPAMDCMRWADATATLSLSAPFVMVSACVAFVMSADNMLLGLTFSREEVLEYAIPARLGALVPTTVALLCLPAWAACGSAYERRDAALLVHHVKSATAGGLLFLAIVAIPLLFFDAALTNAWVGRSFRHQRYILAGYMALGLIIALSSPWNMLLNAAGRIKCQIIPWLATTMSLAAIKPLLLTPSTAWLAPWLTAVAYAVFVSPVVLLTGKRLILDTQMPPTTISGACLSRRQAA